MRTVRTTAAVASVALVLAASAACGSDSKSAPEAPKVHGSITVATGADDPARCDPTDPKRCLLPFPNDRFTRADASTPTKLRLDLKAASMPANVNGVHIDPAAWNRNDGFSPGSALETFVPGIDLAATGTAGIQDPSASLEKDAPIVVVDTSTNKRWPYWAELDQQTTDPNEQMLFVRPAVNFAEGHRYVVALRNPKRADGTVIAPSPAFVAYRDALNTQNPVLESRRAAMERVFADLSRAGVERKDLFLAWDFTVASTENLSERMLHIRDDAFKRLGDEAPRFTVDSTEENVDENTARIVTGTLQVPLYLTDNGVTGSRFNWGSDGLPTYAGSDYTAPFKCVVPRAAVAAGAAPARPVVYGHGLLGTEEEVDATNIRAMTNEHDMVYCATRWIGMSTEDVPNAVKLLQELSTFDTLADRVQQGMLDALFLGRLMIRADGLGSHAAFQANGKSIIDTKELFYDSNSQGGIIGGAATAVSVDWKRAVLGVPGMNYSTLLNRSTDFTDYLRVMKPAYPDVLDRQFALHLIQILWDRAETNGYAAHIQNDPYPGTPAHAVLMHVAFGDFQVANVAAEVEARTIGARIHSPTLADGRDLGGQSLWGIEPIASDPYSDSAFVMWDSGVGPPPMGNVHPDGPHDPHSDPRNYAVARQQKSEFLRSGGRFVDVCNAQACTAPQKPK